MHQIKQILSVMEDFTEQPVIVTENASFVGPKAIRNFYTSLLQLFSKGVVNYTLKKVVVLKDIAYITWQLKTSEVEVLMVQILLLLRIVKFYIKLQELI